MSILKYVMENLKKRKIKKILGLNGKFDCEYVISSWNGNLEYSHSESKNYHDHNHENPEKFAYVRMEEVDALSECHNLLRKIGFKKEFIQSNGACKNNENQLFFGGPLSSESLAEMFDIKSPLSIFERRMKFGVSKNWAARVQDDKFKKVQVVLPEKEKSLRPIFYSNKKDKQEKGKHEQGIPQNNNTIEEYEREGFLDDYSYVEIQRGQSYIVLIRYVQKNKGTKFIAFGRSAAMCTRAIQLVTNNTDDIYDLVKKHKAHFFILIKCAKDGTVIFNEDNIYDLTYEMFDIEDK